MDADEMLEIAARIGVSAAVTWLIGEGVPIDEEKTVAKLTGEVAKLFERNQLVNAREFVVDDQRTGRA